SMSARSWRATAATRSSRTRQKRPLRPGDWRNSDVCSSACTTVNWARQAVASWPARSSARSEREPRSVASSSCEGGFGSAAPARLDWKASLVSIAQWWPGGAPPGIIPADNADLALQCPRTTRPVLPHTPGKLEESALPFGSMLHWSLAMNQPRRTLITSPLALAMAAALPPPAHAATPVRKTIPSSGEELPAIGVGTARRYQGSHDAATLGTLRATLRRFTELGGTVIDTAPSYGNAEAVVGSLLPDLPPDRPLFLATKVGATGRAAGEAQVQASFRRLGRDRLDLVAVHNLQDTAT